MVNPFESEEAHLTCRMYEDQYPSLDEIVMVNVTEIGDMGAYVTLLEYDNIPGMILLSELSKRRIRSIHKLCRVNRHEVVTVLRVDKDKGYIDLSKRQVAPEDIAKCEDRYNKAKAVHSVLRHIASVKSLSLQDLYRSIGWPLYKKYGHAYDAFKLALSGSENEIFDGLDVSDDVRAELVSYIKRRLAPQPVKIRSDIEVTCFTYEGIDAIKEALIEGETLGTSEAPVKIKLIAPPQYVMTSTTLDKELGIARLNEAIDRIRTVLTAKGGVIDVKLAPKVVTLREETELQAVLDRLALEQEAVDGDAPDDA
jgi:translation initiation factor 2 subunit 1